MSAIILPVGDWRLPVDPRINLVGTIGSDGKPALLPDGSTQAEQLQSANGLKAMAFAEGGCHFLKGGDAAATDGYYGLVVVTDAVISAITAGETAPVSGLGNLVGEMLMAGTMVLVPIASITLTSGVVQLMRIPA